MAQVDIDSSFLSYLAREDDSSYLEDRTMVNSCILGELKDESYGSDSTNDSNGDLGSHISPLEFTLTINSDNKNKVRVEDLKANSAKQISVEAVWICKEEQQRVSTLLKKSLKSGGSFALTALVPTKKHAVLSRNAILSGWGSPDSSIKTINRCRLVLQKCGLKVEQMSKSNKTTSKRVWMVVYEEMKKDMEEWGDIVKKCQKREKRGENFLGYLASKVDISAVEIAGLKPLEM
mmetsp:Transcript_25149/g.28755  ORF Transcript_25149/g.28755 Transcript_25149/m.28755 type:complete len:234 (-) Transcript_25149:351-1052(-)|eukprot:CAMPEP_0114997158 /NCGR_PEP_ID=MMETSP0216-20121206/14740_1 /TAXON_ID=223996 /ORGANISM="Protocruzia adherens, Strain Boccale" /LENGTH=233 /DNA_ID=CAMNT_0002361501 /DNA_START=112 /DNA_END=813 /DNA_ORIENTATION=+